MVKRYYANVVLEGLAFDLQRMVREKRAPKEIMNVLEKKVSFLQGNASSKYAYKLVWWEPCRAERQAVKDHSEEEWIENVLEGDY